MMLRYHRTRGMTRLFNGHKSRRKNRATGNAVTTVYKKLRVLRISLKKTRYTFSTSPDVPKGNIKALIWIFSIKHWLILRKLLTSNVVYVPGRAASL